MTESRQRERQTHRNIIICKPTGEVDAQRDSYRQKKGRNISLHTHQKHPRHNIVPSQQQWLCMVGIIGSSADVVLEDTEQISPALQAGACAVAVLVGIDVSDHALCWVGVWISEGHDKAQGTNQRTDSWHRALR